MSFEDNFESDAYDEEADTVGQLSTSVGNKMHMVNSASRGKHIKKPASGEHLDMDEDDRDGLDIQSLSVVEAEFMYDESDSSLNNAAVIANVGTSNNSSTTNNAPKRMINLDAFNIIKVIGKGIVFH